MRAILGGVLLGLTVAYPALAALAWHVALLLTGTTGTVAGWALHQPLAVAALAGYGAWRYTARTVRRRSA